jgi:hypothetical protein
MRPLRRVGSKGQATPGPDAAGVGTIEPPAEGAPPDEGRSRRRYDPAWDDWKRPRRWPGVLLTCVIVLGFLSAVIWHYRPHTVHHKAGHTLPRGKHPQPAFTPVVTGPGSTVKTFTGSSNRTGMPFTATGNLLLVHASCACTYTFAVTVTDPTGNVVALPVDNTSASFNGTFHVPVPLGRYDLTVVGDGPWVVQVLQPGPTVPVIRTPFTYYSTSQSVVGPFSAADKYLSFRFLSLSNGTVFVHVVSQKGVDVLTPFAGRIFVHKTVTLLGLPNPYYLEIDVSGYWSLAVRSSP